MVMSERQWMHIFSNNLNSLLRNAQMTQRELAEETGISEATISRYIHEQAMPSVPALVNICHVFECEIDEILYFGYKMELRPPRR